MVNGWSRHVTTPLTSCKSANHCVTECHVCGFEVCTKSDQFTHSPFLCRRAPGHHILLVIGMALPSS